MDTPEKSSQIATPLSKFEDSPVFNYINSLSPIKPVKSLPVTQTFNSLNFASLPSIFTSPQVSSHKETRFFIRNNCSDPYKPEFSAENDNKSCTNNGVAADASQLYDTSAELQENFDHAVSIEEVSVEASSDSKFAIELPRALKYDCGSPGCYPSSSGIETNCVSELASTSASVVPFVQVASENVPSEGEVHLQGMSQIEPKKEMTGCDWESSISDAADLLIFNFPNASEAFKGLIQKSMDPGARCASVRLQFPQNDFSGEPRMHMTDPVGSDQQHEMGDQSTQETSIQNEINQAQDNPNDDLDECLTGDPSEQIGADVGMSIPVTSKPISNLHRVMLRRCLDFELVARRKNLDDCSNCSSSMILPSDEKIASEDKQLVPLRPSSESSRCILPGIGLHLNALAISSQDNKSIWIDSLSTGRQMSLPDSTASFLSPKASEDPLYESLPSATTERDMVAIENDILPAEDASHTSAHLAGEEYNKSSPKKKRRRMENAGEGDACKRCNCKKSKCLKLYCECFAAGVYCIEPCSCQECFNKPIHEDTVLATRKQIESRNPLAFAPKVIRSSDCLPELGLQEDSNKTPASARHKRGCNCKKSSCLKKYCECFQGGVGCSINCRCEACKNTFGRKDGSALTETEAEAEEEETEAFEKSEVDKTFQKTEIPNNEVQNTHSALPTTPLQLCRSLVQLPFSSKCKPPRSLLAIGSSSGFYTGPGKSNILQSQPKSENCLQSTPEDEMPEILQGNSTPSSGIKTSPRSKRVSPPNTIFRSSPSRRSGRKLILQSIPSFPSLTPQH